MTFQMLEGAIPYQEEDAQAYLEQRWWSGLTLGDLLDRAAYHPPGQGSLRRPG